MQRIRDGCYGKRPIRRTDVQPKSYAQAASVNDEITNKATNGQPRQKNKNNLEENNNVLLKSIRKIVGNALENRVDENLREARKDLMREVDHKMNVRESKFENKLISILKNCNFNGLSPKKFPKVKTLRENSAKNTEPI